MAVFRNQEELLRQQQGYNAQQPLAQPYSMNPQQQMASVKNSMYTPQEMGTGVNTKKKNTTSVKVPKFSAGDGSSAHYHDMVGQILAQIGNAPKFKYEFNRDPLFQYYSDLYQNQGKQAMMDTTAQAAAQTGGYGNSYGASVGNQAYQNWLSKIYDKGLEFRDIARQNYDADMQNLYNLLGAYQGAESSALQREQWEWEKAQAEAAAAAAAGRGGRTGNGTGNTYYGMNGKVYKLVDGKYVLVDEKDIKPNDQIDTSIEKQLEHRRRNLGR